MNLKRFFQTRRNFAEIRAKTRATVRCARFATQWKARTRVLKSVLPGVRISWRMRAQGRRAGSTFHVDPDAAPGGRIVERLLAVVEEVECVESSRRQTRLFDDQVGG